jgi:hypothetical protein
VAELPSGALVFAGTTQDPFDVATLTFATHTGPQPWDSLQQVAIGTDSIYNVADTVAVSRHRLPVAMPGEIVLGGLTHLGQNSTYFAYALTLDGTTLQPRPGTGRLYGEHTHAYGLSVLPTGLAFVGSDQNGAADPGGEYFVATDRNGHTSCSLSWEPRFVNAKVDVVKLRAEVKALTLSTRTPTLRADAPVTGPKRACPITVTQ